MGKMNLLKANYSGKVGQTVGAKWKAESTLRTYSKPANPKTEAQMSVRGAFAELTAFIALFADSIKYLTALDTSNMSVRNAIIKLNKAMISDGEVSLDNLIVSKGGLQKPTGVVMTNASGQPKFTWVKPTATNFTENAQAIAIFVDADDQIVDVVTAKASDLAAESAIDFGTDTTVRGYLYFLDKRGTNKVASLSVSAKVEA